MTAASGDFRSGRPTWTVDTLDVAAYPRTDDLGREWCVNDSGDDGWINPPATRTQRADRPMGIGSYRSAGYRDYRQFTLGGYVACPTWALREQTELELAALCSDPERLYQFRRRTDSYDQTAMVELDAAPKISMVTSYRLDWLFTFAAPDPRKRSYGWQDPISTLVDSGTGGVDYAGSTGYGVNYFGSTGYGVDWGTPGLPAQAQVANYGTAPASPLFTILGPVTQPIIVDVDTGDSIAYGGTLVAGETVVINADPFPQRGYMGYRCVSSVRGNVRSLLPFIDTWPQVDPQSTARYQLVGLGGSGARLTVSFSSAWW